ncbi:alpha/beta-hydrolase [Lepidopterella palustris CBS 459.81]|uniref:Alpha/beta-hydrolase n=1 Tax=Lepidopterella palustris CBS 459.81 TaxID=1314670 RepID=A0A8E2JEM2_9PEZI|nr:alpha/beta-hydrolase [Lepidopterella palustris CBS 459.81]
MADEDVATRAPESDINIQTVENAEQSVFAGDSKAQEGASMGEHCVTDRPTPAGEIPTGEMSKLGGVDVYVSKPSNYPHSPSKFLLLLTGGTGLKSANNQLQADKYASEGFLVVMPDQFEGDTAPNSVNATLVEEHPSFIEQVKLRVAEAAKSFTIDMWLAKHTPEKVLPLLHKVIEGAKEEFADAIANGGGIYGVGYCFGAKYILILAGEHPDTVAWGQVAPKDEEEGVVKHAPVIKAGAIAHGTMVMKEDIEAVKVPMYMACVEDDPLFSAEVVQAGREALEKNGVEHEIQTYSGVPHGFAVLGDYEDRKIKESQSQAFGQMLGWIQGH